MGRIGSLLKSQLVLGAVGALIMLGVAVGGWELYRARQLFRVLEVHLSDHRDDKGNPRTLTDALQADLTVLHALVARAQQQIAMEQRQAQTRAPALPSANVVTAPPTITGGQTPVPEAPK